MGILDNLKKSSGETSPTDDSTKETLQDLSSVEETNDSSLTASTPEESILQENKKESEKERIRREKEEAKIRKEAEKKAKKETKKVKKIKAKDPTSAYKLTNGFFILVLIASVWFTWYKLLPLMKEVETYKNDIPKVQTDVSIVKSNLSTLEQYNDKAFIYRKNLDLIDRAVPVTDKYEDNIVILTDLLKKSITRDDKEQKLLDTLKINPEVTIKEATLFNTDREDIKAIEYSIDVSGFNKYEYIKDFLKRLTNRLRVYHVRDIGIVKVKDKYNPTKSIYVVKLKIYSYYRLPKTDSNGIPLEFKENTFK